MTIALHVSIREAREHAEVARYAQALRDDDWAPSRIYSDEAIQAMQALIALKKQRAIAIGDVIHAVPELSAKSMWERGNVRFTRPLIESENSLISMTKLVYSVASCEDAD